MEDYMVKCLNSLFAQNCRTEPNGQISIISIYNSIVTPTMPLTIPLCFICFLELSLENYQKSDIKDLEIRILVNQPWGTNISDMRAKPHFVQRSDEVAISHHVTDFGNVEFFEFGKYEFQVFLNKVSLLHTNFLEILEGSLT